MKQTLEEVAEEKWLDSKSNVTSKKSFIAGANWQKEQQDKMYSDREVLAMLLMKHDGLSPEYVLQQFKNK